jgi:hypothetical protein
MSGGPREKMKYLTLLSFKLCSEISSNFCGEMGEGKKIMNLTRRMNNISTVVSRQAITGYDVYPWSQE